MESQIKGTARAGRRGRCERNTGATMVGIAQVGNETRSNNWE